MKRFKDLSKIVLLVIIALSIKFTGCEQEDLDFYIDCDSCFSDIPEWDTIWVFLTINDENPSVPLEFFIGDYEDGEEDWIDTAYSERFWLISEVGVEYSVKATYKKGNKTIIAVDGDRIQVGEAECDPLCYYTRGGTMDLRLKEDS